LLPQRLSPKQHEDTKEDVSDSERDIEKDERLPRVSEDSVAYDKVSSKFGYGTWFNYVMPVHSFNLVSI
jgi:hypothetical protein